MPMTDEEVKLRRDRDEYIDKLGVENKFLRKVISAQGRLLLSYRVGGQPLSGFLIH